MHGLNGMNWGMGFGMGFGWLIGILVLFFVIWAITKGFNTSNNPSIVEKKSTIDILKERYARGEINKQEFEEKKRVLST